MSSRGCFRDARSVVSPVHRERVGVVRRARAIVFCANPLRSALHQMHLCRRGRTAQRAVDEHFGAAGAVAHRQVREDAGRDVHAVAAQPPRGCLSVEEQVATMLDAHKELAHSPTVVLGQKRAAVRLVRLQRVCAHPFSRCKSVILHPQWPGRRGRRRMQHL
jgi:hypothetical protein